MVQLNERQTEVRQLAHASSSALANPINQLNQLTQAQAQLVKKDIAINKLKVEMANDHKAFNKLKVEMANDHKAMEARLAQAEKANGELKAGLMAAETTNQRLEEENKDADLEFRNQLHVLQNQLQDEKDTNESIVDEYKLELATVGSINKKLQRKVTNAGANAKILSDFVDERVKVKKEQAEELGDEVEMQSFINNDMIIAHRKAQEQYDYFKRAVRACTNDGMLQSILSRAKQIEDSEAP
jgi:hypothetical protein